jgi:WD40 repeat protein
MGDLSGTYGPKLIGLQAGATLLSFNGGATGFTTSGWGTVVEWDLSGASTALQAILNGHKSTVTAISFTQDGMMLATGSWDGEIRVWNIKGQQLGDTIFTRNGAVVALRLSADGQRVLAVSGHGAVQEWVRKGPAPSPLVAGGTATAIDATIGGDGRQVGIVMAGGDARFYDLGTGKSASMSGTHHGWIMGVAFPPKADIIATAGADGTVGLHRPSGEAFGPSIRAAQGVVMSVAFSPDGNVLASAGDDGTVKLWSLSGTQTGQLTGHEGKVLDVRFSPDGRLIATAGADGTARLWLQNGDQVDQWPGHVGYLELEVIGGGFGTAGMSFSPDSRRIAIADSGGSVRIYRIQNLDELLQSACAWLGPYLTSHPDAPRVCGRGI